MGFLSSIIPKPLGINGSGLYRLDVFLIIQPNKSEHWRKQHLYTSPTTVSHTKAKNMCKQWIKKTFKQVFQTTKNWHLSGCTKIAMAFRRESGDGWRKDETTWVGVLSFSSRALRLHATWKDGHRDDNKNCATYLRKFSFETSGKSILKDLTNRWSYGKWPLK